MNTKNTSIGKELEECIKSMMKTEKGFNDFLRLQRLLSGVKE